MKGLEKQKAELDTEVELGSILISNLGAKYINDTVFMEPFETCCIGQG